jgi:nucleoside-diphosphate-sugar epimerase
MVNLFGRGFVGNHYDRLFPCVVNDRNDSVPQIQQGQILYTISTVDNYNILDNPYIDIETNLTKLISVLEHCRTRSVVFNFVSSWFVYGDAELPYKEDSDCRPRGFYSITKRTAEQLLIEYCNQFGIHWRILRLANVIGSGDQTVSLRKNVLTYMIRQLVDNQDIIVHKSGEFLRDYIHVNDVAHAIDLVLNCAPINSIYNIGNNNSMKFIDLLQYAHNKIRSRSQIIKSANGSTQDMIMFCDKLFSLGYRPRYTVSDCIDELIAEAQLINNV